MAKRIAISKLNASTIDIINTIRQNASAEYQSLVPQVTTEKDIPRVGEVLRGYPALANQFLTALVNRIAAVRVKSALFNNAYANLKKGFLEYGETVEEVFVSIAKAREFSAEKAESRELKRTIPDVRAAFHAMNYRVQYPVTIQDRDLERAFLNAEGVQGLIAKIVDSVYTGAEYDEYLLFKYLLIKSITSGKMYPEAVDISDLKNAAVSFRGMSNTLPFMNTEYNAEGVHTTTPREDQVIIMSAKFNAQFDVEVLASAFNMDRADFMGRLYLIDDFTTFDNERFEVVRAGSDQIAEVTAAELELMGDVVAVLVDQEFFQVYDNLSAFTENYVASGLYWNYFYNVWKTVSYSPFSNAVVFVKSTATITPPASVTVNITAKETGDGNIIFTLVPAESAALTGGQINFVQTEDATEKGVAVHPYGAVIMPATVTDVDLQIIVNGTAYTEATLAAADKAGDTLTFSAP